MAIYIGKKCFIDSLQLMNVSLSTFKDLFKCTSECFHENIQLMKKNDV